MTLQEALKINQQNIYTGKSSKGYGFTCFANKDFKPGDFIMHGFGKILDHQTAHCSIQITPQSHYLPTKWTGKYWNHSCDPNAYMITRGDGFPDLRALKPIKKGEEITYSYWMSEYTWAKYVDETKIQCACGSKNCKRKIFSFSQLTKAEQKKLTSTKHCAKYLHSLV